MKEEITKEKIQGNNHFRRTDTKKVISIHMGLASSYPYKELRQDKRVLDFVIKERPHSKQKGFLIISLEKGLSTLGQREAERHIDRQTHILTYFTELHTKYITM